MLKCIFDVRTATGDMGNVPVALHDLFQKELMDISFGLCSEVANNRWDGVSDMNIGLVFVHTGYIVGAFSPTIAFIEKNGKFMEGDEGYMTQKQRVFRIAKVVCGKIVKNSFVQIDGGIDWKKKFWVAKVLLLSRIGMHVVAS